ncbi:MAG: hypothetical protein LBN32_02420 [Helicobacteraceae bacterium]|jgi:CRISPR type III-B/RAMP module-associated protein Cmr3|nr:hypothetical protein [Helicobacteraceae bacterium]
MVCSVNALIPWVEEDDAESIGGRWINTTFFDRSGIKYFKSEELLCDEDRIGIGIDYAKKSVVKGQLFTARHIRLLDNVTIVIAIDGEYGLGEKGVMRLGGEGRMCHYEKIKTPPQFSHANNGKYFVALAPILCPEQPEELLSKAFAAKTFVVSGWDMRRRQHKSSQTWFYAGSVFTEKIGDECVALSQ